MVNPITQILLTWTVQVALHAFSLHENIQVTSVLILSAKDLIIMTKLYLKGIT